MKAPCAGMQGKMLPSVTAEDNGDVLTVVEGAWDKATPSSGGASSFIVNVVVTLEDGTGALVIESVDKTLSEVITAYTNGSDIKAKMTMKDDPHNAIRVMSLSVIGMTDGQDSVGAQFDSFMPTFANGAITEIMGFHFSMFPNGNVVESGVASFV